MGRARLNGPPPGVADGASSASKPLAADLDTTTKLPEGLIRRPK
jgi:hypothetical protein